MQVILATALILYFIVVEFLDWQDRAELIERQYPKLWKSISNRPGRVVILLVAIALLIHVYTEERPKPQDLSKEEEVQNKPKTTQPSDEKSSLSTTPGNGPDGKDSTNVKRSESTDTGPRSVSVDNRPPVHAKTTEETQAARYASEVLIRTGNTLADPATGAALGLLEVSVDNTAKMNLTLPGARPLHLDKAEPGTIWRFQSRSKTYTLMLTEVNYIGDFIKVRIAEIPK